MAAHPCAVYGMPTAPHTFNARPQYAIPLRFTPDKSRDTARSLAYPPSHLESEHLLRRKTPSGTVMAGYNGALLEPSDPSHVAKHMLIPAQHPPKLVPNAQSQQVFAAGPPQWSSSSHSGPGRTAQPEWTDFSNQLTHSTPLSLDSNLYQGYHHTDGRPYEYFPKALPPSMRSPLGPTVSNEHAPYGPYWPNGTFVPYQPAAFEDPRFYDRSGYDSHGHFFPSPFTPEVVLPHGTHSHPQHNQHEALLLPPTYLRQGDEGVDMPYDRGSMGFERSQRNSRGRPDYDRNSRSYPLPAPKLDQSNHPGDSMYPDRVLSWAHSIYTDLVTSCRQARRSSSIAKGFANPATPALSIFPAPPRRLSQRASSFPQSSHTHPRELLRSTTFASQHSAFDHSAGKPGLPQKYSQVEPNTAQNYFSSPSAIEQLPQGNSRHTDVHNSWNPPSQTFDEQSSTSRSRTSRNSSSYSDSPQEALDILTKLCRQSDWTWVEGMLLGGCLAYILGDHLQASQWYSRILVLDSNHVEALSNLAAAMLALNQRRDAERCWRQAVSLRPGYFEAIEHLVGLLCFDQRTTDAIEVISQMQRGLKIRGSSSSPSGTPLQLASPIKRHLKKDQPGHIDDAQSLDETPGFGSSGYAIPGSENGRILSLIHAKGNILYNMQDQAGAAAAFEECVLIGAGGSIGGIDGLIHRINTVFRNGSTNTRLAQVPEQPLFLPPEVALQTARKCFPDCQSLPGLQFIENKMGNKAALSVTSNALLSLAKIFQDGMTSTGSEASSKRITRGVKDILSLYYLSLSLHPSPSTANNVGILLASAAGSAQSGAERRETTQAMTKPSIPGVVPGSGIALALAYYNYGLSLDSKHAHLYTNLGSLLKDIGQLPMAIRMYEKAVSCDGTFDIALANLANAVKDQGRVADAITYYKRAVRANPQFAEAVCGLANALNSICSWTGRGGIVVKGAAFDRWHVNEDGMLADSQRPGAIGSGWMNRVVETVDKQLIDGRSWGKELAKGNFLQTMLRQMTNNVVAGDAPARAALCKMVENWSSSHYLGAKFVRLLERYVKRVSWQWYQDRYVHKSEQQPAAYSRPKLPAVLNIPGAPTVLPFHTFTCPMTARQIRMISQRNGLRVSCSVLKSNWLPSTVFPPPSPPNPHLNVGYVSSDFNNHPLAHLMQSVFGMHDSKRVRAFCYATTATDKSVHRQQIEKEAPVFYDASAWSLERLVRQIVDDGIHILVNLNGYTRGARNEVFGARPAPIQMSFMGFAGTLGAEWCDYLLADETSIPPSTLRPYRRSLDLADLEHDDNIDETESSWVYAENIIYTRSTFFCCDHAQSASPSHAADAERNMSYASELTRRWHMRKHLFPDLPDDTIILANFNQLYKIDPATFRSWLRILSRVPNAVLWLLRFPALGEAYLRSFARSWAGEHVANRLLFTDVAAKGVHIARAAAADLFLDTPECNAHTTAADCLWSGTPFLTWGRYEWKMCSRMGGGILKGALEWSGVSAATAQAGHAAWSELVATSAEEYEERAVALAEGVRYSVSIADGVGRASGRLADMRRLIWSGRWCAKLFDTRRWVRDVEDGYEEAWRRWVSGQGGDIWLKDL